MVAASEGNLRKGEDQRRERNQGKEYAERENSKIENNFYLCWIHTFRARSHHEMSTRKGTTKYATSSSSSRCFSRHTEKVKLNIKNIINSILLISNNATC